MHTATQKLEALEREIKFRQRVYARRVELKTMTQQQADYQIAIFQEIAADYREPAQKEKLL